MPTDPRWLLGLLAGLRPQQGPDGLPKRHQPLTLLWAIGRARNGRERLAPWPIAGREVGRLIEEFGRETDARNPHLPFLALATHPELWELTATPPPKGRAGDARLAWLNDTRPWVRGGLSRAAHHLLATSAEATSLTVDALLSTYFEDIDPPALLHAVNLDSDGAWRWWGGVDRSDADRGGAGRDGGGRDGRGRDDRKLRGGAGYVADAVLRRAVERHAVDLAIAFYRERGYEVTDVGAIESYDLRAVCGDDEVHVEVKGSTGTAENVELTSAEVRQARTARTDLFVVDRIEWERLPDGGIRTSGGRQRHWACWRPVESDLDPSRYRYRLPPP